MPHYCQQRRDYFSRSGKFLSKIRCVKIAYYLFVGRSRFASNQFGVKVIENQSSQFYLTSSTLFSVGQNQLKLFTLLLMFQSGLNFLPYRQFAVVAALGSLHSAALVTRARSSTTSPDTSTRPALSRRR